MKKKKNKKERIHELKKSGKSELERFVLEVIDCYPDKKQELLEDYREVKKQDFIGKAPKKYRKSVFYDFYVMMYADIFIGYLKACRKAKELSAAEVDEKLGYTKGYTMASLKNTSERPTVKNVKTTFEIFQRMTVFFGDDTEKITEFTNLGFMNMTDIIDRAFIQNGYKRPSDLLEGNQSTMEVKKIEDKTEKEKITEEFELVIENQRLFFKNNDSAIDLLKLIKNNTDIEIEVFETIKEKVI